MSDSLIRSDNSIITSRVIEHTNIRVSTKKKAPSVSSAAMKSLKRANSNAVFHYKHNFANENAEGDDTLRELPSSRSPLGNYHNAVTTMIRNRSQDRL